MRFLSGGDAVIIDMRKNGGGDPAAVRYLVSHFLAPDTKLMTFYMGSNRVDTTAALPKTIAPRMVGKPLYVLTSGGTASAAEEFIGHVAGLQAWRADRREHRRRRLPQPLLPSPRRPVDQHLGRPGGPRLDRQRLGSRRLCARHRVPVDQALEVAEAHALKRLASTAPPEKRRPLEVQAAMLLAQTAPVQTALPLRPMRRLWRTDGDVRRRETLRSNAAGRAEQPDQSPSARTSSLRERSGATLTFDVAGIAATALHLVRSDGPLTRRNP